MINGAWRRVAYPVCYTAIAALMGMAFVDTEQLWYQSLMKPEIMPPDAVFSCAWCAIYILIAVSGVLVLKTGDKTLIKDAGCLYGVNAVLNVFWTYTFFDRHRMVPALFVMIALIFSTMHLMRRLDKCSGVQALMLLPYLLWLIFSLALNYAIALMN